MSNVKALYGGPTGLPEPNEEAIKAIEEFLEKARSGEVVGVAIAVIHADGLASFQLGGYIGRYSLIGALEILKKRIMDIVEQ